MRHTCLSAILLLPLASRWVSALNVSLPTSAPPNAASLRPTLVSFSLEQDRWPDWVGVRSRNEFTNSALGTLGALTGHTPNIRVGANSEDRTVWSPTVTVIEASGPPPNTITPFPEASRIAVGDAYYALSRFLPRGTRMTWGINLGADSATNAVNMARAVMRAFASAAVRASGVVLDALEVGNEPDLFGNNGLRAPGFAVGDYVPDWIAIAGAMAKAVGISGRRGPVTLWGASFASTGFTPQQIFDLGILDSAPGKAISTISQHRYSAVFCNGGDFPLTSFMSKTFVRGNLSAFIPAIAATRARGLDYILGETNSIACHGAPGVSNTAGAAVWTIDYTLQAASMRISELYFHEGVGYKYNFLQPIALNVSIIDGSPVNPPTPPRVQPPFYGGLVINSLIGRSGSAKIVELSVDDANVSGYAAFERGRLARAVFINLNAWLASSTGPRPSVHINLSGLPAGRVATAKRLAIQHADDTAGLKWAGQSYETANAKPSGRLVTERVNVRDGFDLHATEVVLLSF